MAVGHRSQAGGPASHVLEEDIVELADRNLLAAFRDRERAQQAIEVLGAKGFRDEDVSLLGQPLDEIGDTEPDPTTDQDVRTGNVPANTFAGITIGSLAGGALGLAGTALVAAIPGVNIAGIGLLAGAIGSAGLGGTVGGLVEGEAALRTDHSWGQAVEAAKAGAIVVGVHDPARVDEAAEALAPLVPQTMHVTDGRGTVLEDRTPEGQPGPGVEPERSFETRDDAPDDDGDFDGQARGPATGPGTEPPTAGERPDDPTPDFTSRNA